LVLESSLYKAWASHRGAHASHGHPIAAHMQAQHAEQGQAQHPAALVGLPLTWHHLWCMAPLRVHAVSAHLCMRPVTDDLPCSVLWWYAAAAGSMPGCAAASTESTPTDLRATSTACRCCPCCCCRPCGCAHPSAGQEAAGGYGPVLVGARSYLPWWGGSKHTLCHALQPSQAARGVGGGAVGVRHSQRAHL